MSRNRIHLDTRNECNVTVVSPMQYKRELYYIQVNSLWIYEGYRGRFRERYYDTGTEKGRHLLRYRPVYVKPLVAILYLYTVLADITFRGYIIYCS